jgi:hypothetical protein
VSKLWLGLQNAAAKYLRQDVYECECTINVKLMKAVVDVKLFSVKLLFFFSSRQLVEVDDSKAGFLMEKVEIQGN